MRLKKQQTEAGRSKPKICEVCGRGGKIVFDHCHGSKKFRGWLCNGCNVILGYANDSPEILKKLIRYLLKHERSRNGTAKH